MIIERNNHDINPVFVSWSQENISQLINISEYMAMRDNKNYLLKNKIYV